MRAEVSAALISKGCLCHGAAPASGAHAYLVVTPLGRDLLRSGPWPDRSWYLPPKPQIPAPLSTDHSMDMDQVPLGLACRCSLRTVNSCPAAGRPVNGV